MLVCVTRCFDLPLLISHIYTGDGHPNQPRLSSDQPVLLSQKGINYGGSSRPLYTMYSKIVQEEDNKIVERNRQSTDGVLIVVSPRVQVTHSFLCTQDQSKIIDWFILCHCRRNARSLDPRSQAQRPGYLDILPCEHSSAFGQPKYTWIDPSFEKATCVLSTTIRHLGEHTLVVVPTSQPIWCHDSDVRTTFCTSIHHDYPKQRIFSRNSSEDARNVCQDQVVRALKHEDKSRISTLFLPPLHSWFPHLLRQRQSSRLLDSGFLDHNVHASIYIIHGDTYFHPWGVVLHTVFSAGIIPIF